MKQPPAPSCPGKGRKMIEFFPPNFRLKFRALLPIFRTNCPDGSHFAQMGLNLPRWGLIPEYHLQPMFFSQPSHAPFGDIYVHKTNPTPPHPRFLAWTGMQAKWTNIWAKWDPNWEICLKSGQNVSRRGRKRLLAGNRRSQGMFSCSAYAFLLGHLCDCWCKEQQIYSIWYICDLRSWAVQTTIPSSLGKLDKGLS